MPPKNVSLFITCLTDQFYPRVGVAVTRILEHFGCRVYFPEGQTCCGQPFFNNGFHPEAAELARRMIAIFEPFEVRRHAQRKLLCHGPRAFPGLAPGGSRL